MTGVDFFFPPFETMVKQPNIKDISLIGEAVFFKGIDIFSASDKSFYIKRKIESAPEEERGSLQAELDFTIQDDLSAFTALILDEEINSLIIETLMFLIFPNFRAMRWDKIGPSRMLISIKFKVDLNKEEIDLIKAEHPENYMSVIEARSFKTFQFDGENFEQLKNLISFLFSYKTEAEKESEPAGMGAMATKIAEQIRLAQEKRDKMYGRNSSEKAPESIISSMVSIVSTSDGIVLTEVLKLTFPQLLIQLDRTQRLRQFTTQITLGAFGGLEADDIIDWRNPV